MFNVWLGGASGPQNQIFMYTASKKTRKINSFVRSSVISPRDLYAKYGMRFNTRAIHSSDGKTSSIVVPEGAAVIGQMIAGQNELRRIKPADDDLPK